MKKIILITIGSVIAVFGIIWVNQYFSGFNDTLAVAMQSTINEMCAKERVKQNITDPRLKCYVTMITNEVKSQTTFATSLNYNSSINQANTYQFSFRP